MDASTALAAIDAAPRTKVGQSSPAVKSVTGDDYINISPATLASAAQLDTDTYALARMVASEYGDHSASYMLACAECAVAQAAHNGTTITQLLTHSSHPEMGTDGYFARNGSGHWASTILQPNAKHVAAAKGAIAGSALARGARDYIEPAGQNVGAIQGNRTIQISAQDYIDKNYKAGLVWVGDIAGIDPTILMLFADSAKVSNPVASLDSSNKILDKISIVAFLFLVGAVTLAYAAA